MLRWQALYQLICLLGPGFLNIFSKLNILKVDSFHLIQCKKAFQSIFGVWGVLFLLVWLVALSVCVCVWICYCFITYYVMCFGKSSVWCWEECVFCSCWMDCSVNAAKCIDLWCSLTLKWPICDIRVSTPQAVILPSAVCL